MNPSDFFLYIFASFGIGAVVAGGIVFLLLKHHLPSYLAEKGKNLATKEDISEITDKVERVRSQYSVLLEELKAKHQLRVAALDHRLKAHQEAFTLWREILGAVHTDQIGSVVIKCQDWWEKNCLYLEPSVREAFVASYSAAHMHHALTQPATDREALTANWDQITRFPNILFEAVQLPALSSVESKALDITPEQGPHG
jgi:hypothetical protein